MLPVALHAVGSAVKLLSALDGAVIPHSTSLPWDARRAALARGLVGDNGTIQPRSGPRSTEDLCGTGHSTSPSSFPSGPSAEPPSVTPGPLQGHGSAASVRNGAVPPCPQQCQGSQIPVEALLLLPTSPCHSTAPEPI